MKKKEEKVKKVLQYKEPKQVFPTGDKISRWKDDVEVPPHTVESKQRPKVEREAQASTRDRNESQKLYTLEEAKAICKAECEAKKKSKKK